MNEKVVEIKDLVVRYGNNIALDHISLEVERGDVLGIVGPNGGGKTTLLNTILANLAYESGEIRLFGEDLRSFKDFQRIGYVAQHAIQFDPIFPATVEEIVTLGCLGRTRFGKRLSAKDRDSIRKAMEVVGIDDLRKKKISHLSGGQKQRIFIAKALVNDPELLIFDEATGGLDVCIQDRFITLLRNLRKERGVTIITVSHDLSSVMCQANKLAVVNRKIYCAPISPEMDPTEALRRAYGEHFTFVFHNDSSGCHFH